ncbi:MAG: phosphotriesterase, partial [Chloroflexi bacterium]|nr:phosphotriesterase [Chloroflexota bacterium]
YLFIKRRVEPRLVELGISRVAVSRINTENPQRFFEGKK